MSQSKEATAAMIAARIKKSSAAPTHAVDEEEAILTATRRQVGTKRKQPNNDDDEEEVLESENDAAAEEDDDDDDEEEEEEEGVEGEVDESGGVGVTMMAEEGEEESKKPSAPPKKASKPAMRSHLEDELEADDWDTERDEAAEAAATLQPTKRRRLTKASDVEAAAAAAAASSHRHSTLEEDDDGFVVDDMGGFDRDDDYGVKRDKKVMESIQLQKSFQPSATAQEQGGRKRFLAWNSVGSISTTEQDSTATAGIKLHVIELLYADNSKMKTSKFRDFYNFTVAALGEHGAVFASATSWDKTDKKEIPSTVFFRPSDTWDNKNSSEWQLQMDLAAKEEAALVAIGDTWVAVATNKQYVRIISHSGIQKFILSLGGPCVTMVGRGSTLAIVFHDGIPLPGHQNLALIVMDIVNQKEVYRGKCVISPRSKLTWIGYSDIGMLLCMDSFGVVRALGRSWDWQWTPILDTNLLKKAGSTDTYWPVSLLADKLMCVLLRNGARVPSVQPRPALQSVSMQLPFLDLANENRVSLGEEAHSRFALLWYNDEHGGMGTSSRFFTSKQETTQDKLILGLVQKALQLDRSTKALDLCTMLHKKKAVEIAVQMATLQKKTALAQRITMLLQVKFAMTLGHARDDEGLSSFLDAPSAPAPAPAAAPSKRGTLRRPPVSFESAAEENRAAGLADDEEAEYDFGSSAKPSSTPLASLSTSLSGRTIASANVKPKAATAAPSPSFSSTTASNPFARK